jgi:hypothetical protein
MSHSLFTNHERGAINNEHAKNPQPGDYWVEMFCGVCVVLSVSGRYVTLCKTKKDVDRDYWTWDLDQAEIMTRDQFNDWLHYECPELAHKTWCDCSPRAHLWAVEEAAS